jgi:Ser-tRNA(Ala) deacylase AlaX
MPPSPTKRLYWHDDHCFNAGAVVVDVNENAIAFDQTCFYPGGGGQPSDEGSVTIAGEAAIEIKSADARADGMIWHVAGATVRPARLCGLDHRRTDRGGLFENRF